MDANKRAYAVHNCMMGDKTDMRCSGRRTWCLVGRRRGRTPQLINKRKTTVILWIGRGRSTTGESATLSMDSRVETTGPATLAPLIPSSLDRHASSILVDEPRTVVAPCFGFHPGVPCIVVLLLCLRNVLNYTRTMHCSVFLPFLCSFPMADNQHMQPSLPLGCSAPHSKPSSAL